MVGGQDGGVAGVCVCVWGKAGWQVWGGYSTAKLFPFPLVLRCPILRAAALSPVSVR